MFKIFEEEIGFLEEWLARDTCTKDYIEFIGLSNYENKIRNPYSGGIGEKKM